MSSTKNIADFVAFAPLEPATPEGETKVVFIRSLLRLHAFLGGNSATEPYALVAGSTY